MEDGIFKFRDYRNGCEYIIQIHQYPQLSVLESLSAAILLLIFIYPNYTYQTPTLGRLSHNYVRGECVRQPRYVG